jgi:REP element-mobilizing transposase RayT
MTRLPMLSLPSIPQHIIQRGNNRQACFYADEDYRFYVECLGEVARKLFRMHLESELLKAVRQATQTNRVFGAGISSNSLKLLLHYA